jgi:hypothetical protein
MKVSHITNVIKRSHILLRVITFIFYKNLHNESQSTYLQMEINLLQTKTEILNLLLFILYIFFSMFIVRWMYTVLTTQQSTYQLQYTEYHNSKDYTAFKILNLCNLICNIKTNSWYIYSPFYHLNHCITLL